MEIKTYRFKDYKLHYREQGSYKCHGCVFHNDYNLDSVNTACSILERVAESRILMLDTESEEDMLNLCQYGSKKFAEYKVYARKKLKFV